MDSIKEWMAFIGRRNIAYVVFVSLLVPFWNGDGGRGPTRSRFRWRDHGCDNLVGRGVADLLHSQCRIGNRLYRQRPVAGKTLDRVRSADRLYHPPFALGALLCAVTVSSKAQITGISIPS